VEESPASGIVAPEEADLGLPNFARDANASQQPVAFRRVRVKLRCSNTAQFVHRRISQHSNEGLVAVEDSPVDGRVYDTGKIALVNEIAQLVGRFQRELAFLAGSDVAEYKNRPPDLSG